MTAKAEQLVQYRSEVGYGVDADADGILDILIGRVPPNVSWKVERITFSTSAGPLPLAGASFELFAAEPDPTGAAPPGTDLRSFTTGFTEAEADYSSPVRFWSNDAIMARFSGFPAGFDASMYLQIEEVQEIILPEPEIELPEEQPEQLTPAVESWN